MSNKLANTLTQIFTALLLFSYLFSRSLGLPVAFGLMGFFGACIAGVRFLVEKHARERLFEPLEERKLPRFFRKYVQEGTPEMVREGFRRVGDFLIYPDPVPMRSRAFISEDGRSFGYLAHKESACFYGFLSVFEDGTYLETSPLTPGETQPHPESPIRGSFLPNAPIDKLAAFHRTEIDRIETIQKTRVMEFDREQYAEVADYGCRLSDWDLYNQGVRWTPPKPKRKAGEPVDTPEFRADETAEWELVGADDGR